MPQSFSEPSLIVWAYSAGTTFGALSHTRMTFHSSAWQAKLDRGITTAARITFRLRAISPPPGLGRSGARGGSLPPSVYPTPGNRHPTFRYRRFPTSGRSCHACLRRSALSGRHSPLVDRGCTKSGSQKQKAPEEQAPPRLPAKPLIASGKLWVRARRETLDP